jgi:hypothetical protein
MSEQLDTDLKPMPEQMTYANLLFIGVWIGIAVMMVTYMIYVMGILPPHVDFAAITQNWGRGIHEYLEATHSPKGWGWLALLEKGDTLNFVGVALLALLTMLCYFFLIVGYGKNRDWIYLGIAISEVVVLALAASGILTPGGH